MIMKISPSLLRGEILIPSSKSASQRALALSLLHNGTVILGNLGTSDDELAALSVIKGMGAKVSSIDNERILIEGGFKRNKFEKINCGESGLAVRMFTPIAALSDSEVEITGKGSLLSRPMNFFSDVLPLLGVRVVMQNGKLPLTIKGPLNANDITIDGSLSSQFLTGMLIAYAYSSTYPVNITVNDLTSKPYIDLTLKMLEDFGYKIINHDYKNFQILPVSIPEKKISYNVEGDWSSASFLMVAGATSGNVSIKGLDPFSTQADKNILAALSLAGVSMSVTGEKIEVRRSSVQPFQFDANQCPDLFPPLVALAACAEGKSVIEGTGRLIHKESNRALTLKEEFAKLGIHITLQDDLMIIEGGKLNANDQLDSHHDHRIAMALAIAALRADEDSYISNAEAINKSYPRFFDDLKHLGAGIQQINN